MHIQRSQRYRNLVLTAKLRSKANIISNAAEAKAVSTIFVIQEQANRFPAYSDHIKGIDDQTFLSQTLRVFENV